MISLLAQDSVDVGVVLAYFSERLVTPFGISALILGLSAVGLALITRQGLPMLLWATLFSLTFMIHEATLTHNILIGPLQGFRAVTRPISFALMTLALLAVIGLPRLDRGGSVGFASVSLFVFQVFYGLQLMVFVAPLKGFLGLVSMTLMFFACGIGFGRTLQDATTVERSLRVLFWVALAFLGVNFLQLIAGTSTAVLNGRFVGISGNANQAGAICAVLAICCAYFVNEPSSSRIRRIVAATMLGLLGLLLAWTGSRASALAGLVGFLAMYRLRLGRLAFAAVFVVVVAAVGFAWLSEDTSGAQRLISTENTRATVWAQALRDWMSSPVFGIMPFGQESGVESVPLRTLASMGVLGGLMVLVPIVSIVASLPRALWIGRVRPELRAIADLYLGSMACMLTSFVFEGYLFGVLTFFVMFIHMILAVGHFLDDAYKSERFASAAEDLGNVPSPAGLPAM